jgi:PAS domain S-box-containing protein
MTKQNKNLSISFIIAIFFLLSLSVFTYSRLSSLIESGQMVNHTSQVTLQLERIMGSLKDAETGQRGYLLTLDARFLEPFNKGLKEYPLHIHNLKELIKDSPSQQENLKEVETLIEHRKDYLYKTLEEDKLRKPTMTELFTGKSIMDSLRTQITTMEGIENNLMQERTKHLQKQLFFAPAMILLLSVIAFLILIFSYWRLNKSLRHSQQLQIDIISKNVDLEKNKQVEESKKQIQTVFRQAPAAIALLEGPLHKYALANLAYQKMNSRSEEQMLGKTAREVFPELEGTGTFEILDNVFKTGQTFSMAEYPLMVDINNDGIVQQQYFNFTAAPIKAEGKVASVMVMVFNITEQVVARKKIEESEILHRQIFEFSPVAIWEKDDTALYQEIELLKQKGVSDFRRYLDTNPAEILRLVSLVKLEDVNNESVDLLQAASKQEVITSFHQLFTEESIPMLKEGIIGVAENKKRLTIATVLQSLKGKRLEILISFDFRIGNDLNKSLVSLTDISEQVEARKKIEANEIQLRKTSEYLQIATNAAEVGIWSLDLASQNLDWSPLHKKLWGYDDQRSDLLYEDWHKVILSEDKEASFAEIARALKTKTLYEAAYRIRRSNDGKIRWMKSSGQYFYNEKDEPVTLTGVSIDITDAKEAETSLRKNTQTLEVGIDVAGLAIIEIDYATNLAHLTDKAAKMYFGRDAKAQSVSRQTLHQTFHPESLEKMNSLIKKSLNPDGTGLLQTNHQIIWPNGEVRWLKVSKQLFFNRKGQTSIPEYSILAAQDITNIKEAEEKLLASEERFRLATKASNVGIWEWNVITNKIRWDEQMFRIYGVTPTADGFVAYSTWSNAVAPEELSVQEKILQDTVKNVGMSNRNFKIYRANDGMLRFIEAIETVRTNYAGQAEWVVGTNLDVTEKVLAHKKVEDSEKRYNLMLMQSPFAFAVLKGENMIINLANDSVKEMWGKGKEIEGKPLIEVLPEIQDQGFPELLDGVYTTGIPFSANEILVKLMRNGKPEDVYFSFVYQPYYEADQTISGVTIIAQEVTQEAELNKIIKENEKLYRDLSLSLDDKVKERTAELETSEEKFYTLFNLSPVCTTLSDATSGKIVMVNDAFTNVFGYSPEETLNKNGAKLGMTDPVMHEMFINELKTNGKIKNKEVEFIKKSGEKFFALGSAEVITVRDKQLILATYTDISERKKAEQIIEQKNTELEKMNKELESFAYISSHDLQEPLRKIQTFVSRISEQEENNLSDKGKDMFNRMQEAAKRMQQLIQDLLAYSRTKTQERIFEKTDLNKVLQEVLEDFEEELKGKNAIIEATELCEANIIPFQFRQLLFNLIGNALKFSKPNIPPHIKIKSEITLGIKLNDERLSPKDIYCHITFSDNGIGFEQQYSEKIFEVFKRLHGRDHPGTGIGLAIVKKIVDNHHGIITTTSTVGNGTTFNIFIPA